MFETSRLSDIPLLFATGLLAVLLTSTGCKKDEPEETEEPKASPEKVAEAADDEAIADEGADEATEARGKTRDRKLVKKPGPSKPGASKPGAKPGASKPGAKPGAARPGAKPSDKPTAAGARHKRPSARRGKPGADDVDDDTKDQGPAARRAAARKAVAARRAARPGAVPPSRGVAPARDAKAPAAARPDLDGEDDALDEDDEADTPPRGRAEAKLRDRPGARRAQPRRGGPANDALEEAEDEPPAMNPRKGPRGTPPRTQPKKSRPTITPAREPGGGNLPSRVRPNAELLLRLDDLKELTEYQGGLDVHALPGIEGGEEYDGIFWGSPDGKKYVAGLQIWRMRSPIRAQRRYTQMVRSYPNAEENTAITNKTFLAHWNDFIYLAFFDSGKQTIVSVTCARDVCNEPRKLVLLAIRVRERL